MPSAKQNPCGSMDFEITCVSKDVNRDCGVCLFVLIKTTVTVSIVWKKTEVFPLC